MTQIYIFWIIAGAITAITVLLLLRPLMDKRLALGLTCVVPFATLGLYMFLGRPDLTAWHTRQKLPPFIAASVDKLIEDTHDHPTDIQAWVLLGDVYGKIRNYSDAADAYRHAALLDPTNGTYKAMVGQALVMQNGGAVSYDAMMWFSQGKYDPTARYYEALQKSQAGHWNEALADWQKLRRENLPGMNEMIDARIADADTALGLDQH